MLGENILEGRKGVGGDVKGVHLHIVEEVVEDVVVEDDLGERLMPQALTEDHAGSQSNIRVLVASGITSREKERGGGGEKKE